MILVLGSVVVRDGCLDEALALSQLHTRRSREEPGCIAHAVHLDPENPRRLVYVEKWSDLAALGQHFEVDRLNQPDRLDRISPMQPTGLA